MIRKSCNNRGVVPVIGFLLLILVLVSGYSLFSSAVAPQLAEQTESEQKEQLYNSLPQLTASINDASTQSQSATTTLPTNTEYGIITSSAPIIEQTFETTDSPETTVEVSGFDSQDTDSEFKNGKTGSSVSYDTKRVEFDTVHSYRSFDPFGIEYGVPYIQSDIVGNQFVIDDRTITLPIIKESPSTQFPYDTTLSIDSTEYNETVIDTSSTVEIEMETVQNEDAWISAFSDQKEDGYIDEISFEEGDELNTITIELEPNNEYKLLVSEVSIQSMN